MRRLKTAPAHWICRTSESASMASVGDLALHGSLRRYHGKMGIDEGQSAKIARQVEKAAALVKMCEP